MSLPQPFLLDCPSRRRNLHSPPTRRPSDLVPLVEILPATTPTSSVTEPVLPPPITGTSLVPKMVTVTSLLVLASLASAVKEPRHVGSGPRCWMEAWLSLAA